MHRRRIHDAVTRRSGEAAILSPRRPVALSPCHQISVIIPAYNEAPSIGFVLDAIPRELASNVIVVDNGSTDATAQIARAHGATVVAQPERGYGAACLAGLANLQISNLQSKISNHIIVFLDADFSDYPEDLPQLLAPILEGRADFVLSTRTQDRASRQALTLPQRWGNWLATTLLRGFLGFRYTDLGPLRAIRADALARLQMQDRNYGWTVEMQIKAVQQGLRIVEVPTRYRVRIGRSKISGTVKGVVLAGAKILYTIAKYAL